MEGWEEVPLRAVCRVDKRQGMHANLPYVGLEHIESGTSRFVGSLNAQGVKSTTFRFSNAHVLYGRLRPYLNKVLLPDFDGHCSTEIFPLLPSARLDRHFLCYWLSSSSTVAAIDATCTGARMPRANMDEVLDFALPLPPLPEQQRIVAILDEAFEGIATAKANAEKNLQNARELFDGYLQTIFSEPNPAWVQRRLQDMCAKITDGTHQTPKYFDSGVVFLSSRNVTSGKIDWENIKYIDEKQHIEMHRRVAPRVDDILLAKNGTTGVAAIVDRDTTFDIYVSLALIRSLGEVLPRFLLRFINSPAAKLQFNKRLKGVGVPNLHLEEIREVKIQFPVSLAEQQKVVDSVDQLHGEIEALVRIQQRKLAALDELKKSLLHQAFSGQL